MGKRSSARVFGSPPPAEVDGIPLQLAGRSLHQRLYEPEVFGVKVRYPMKRAALLAIVFLVFASVPTAGGATDAGSGCSNSGTSLRQCIIGSGSASGGRLAKGHGTALHPRSIFIYVYTARPATEPGEWSMTCKRSPRSREGFKGHTFTATTSSPGNPQPNPLNRRGYWGRSVNLKMPIRRPYSCTVQASVGTSVAGQASVYILAIKR